MVGAAGGAYWGAAGGTLVVPGVGTVAGAAGMAGVGGIGGAIWGLVVCNIRCLPQTSRKGPLEQCYEDCELEYSDPVDIAKCKLLCDMMYGPTIH